MCKRIGLVAVLVLILLLLTACDGSKEDYNNAQELLIKGEYSAAADAFESIDSYKDATTLAMYCRACALAESGDYEAGIAALKSMGNFKDCENRIIYYTARSKEAACASAEWEAMIEVKSIYDTIPLFMDSSKRISELNERIAAAKEDLYKSAVETGENGEYAAAQVVFESLGNYSDSEKRIGYYDIRKAEADLADTIDQDALMTIAAQYSDMDGYLDCAERSRALLIRADAIAKARYAQVAALISEGKHAEAEIILDSFGSYGSEWVPENYYAVAENYLAEGKWDEASATFKKAGNYIDAESRINEPYYRQGDALLAVNDEAGAIAAFKKVGNYSDAEERWKDILYLQAERYAAEEKWAEANEILFSLGGYKNSIEKALLHFKNERIEANDFGRFKDNIWFGSYEQDNDRSNSKEPIEWKVLAKDNDRILVVSEYVLDDKPYNEYHMETTWESCTLRQWLNSDFFNEAFSSTEQALIPTVTVSADRNPDRNVDPGNATQDKIFLLSRKEYSQYVSGYYFDDCEPTAYAEKQGAMKWSNGNTSWILRTPGSAAWRVCFITNNGWLYDDRNVTTSDGVRPAMWIDLDP